MQCDTLNDAESYFHASLCDTLNDAESYFHAERGLWMDHKVELCSNCIDRLHHKLAKNRL